MSANNQSLWLAWRVGEGNYKVVFVDMAGIRIFETAMSAVPRAGDHVDLPIARFAGIIERVTWRVAHLGFDSPAIITVRPYEAQ